MVLRHGARLALRAALLAGIALPFALPAVANPQGGQVVAGSATITQPQANTTQINQSSSSAIINWQSFSIAPNETTIFNQPSSSSITLNRVVGSDPSVIAGRLQANGNLVLVNQNGIAFSNGAQVNVNSIIATPADIRNSDFMAGKLDFSIAAPKGATVTNAGTITVAEQGLAALVAPGVANSGTINAKLGKVVLAGKESFAVDLYGDGLLSFDLGAKASAALSAGQVANSGTINADGGSVLLTADVADQIVSGVVNLGGEIHARTASGQAGSVIADAGAGGRLTVSGSIDATGTGVGESGGTVKLLGKEVGLAATAKVDASGDAGGGTVLVGGNFHGAGPERNATTTLVAGGALLRADALGRGNGGKIAIWSDGTTEFAGTISARGGARGGNGGFVETSGKGTLQVGGAARVDAGATYGVAGTWLLDPTDIFIVHSAGTAAVNDANFATFNNTGTDANGSSSTITDTVINAATASVTLLANRDITIGTNAAGTADAAAISLTQSLTLSAGRSISITNGSTIAVKGAGNSLSLTANAAGATPGAGVASFKMDAGTSLSTTAGDIGVTLAANGNAASLGTMQLGKIGSGGKLAVSSAGTISQVDVVSATGTSSFTTTAAGAAIQLASQANLLTGAISLTTASGGDAQLRNGLATQLDASNVRGALTVNSSGTLSEIGVLSVGGASNFTVTGNGAAIQLASQTNLLTGDVQLTTSTNGDAQLLNGQATHLGASNIQGALSVNSTGTISESGVVKVGGTSDFKTTDPGAAILLASQSNGFTGTVSLTTGSNADAQLKNNQATDLGTSHVTGALNISSVGTITESGVLTVDGASQIATTSSGAAIKLGTQANAFAGDVALTTTGTGDAQLKNGGGVSLAASDIGGALSVTAGGDISETGILKAGGGGSFTTNAGNGAILLASQNNTLSGDIAVTTAGNGDAQLKNAGAVSLAASKVGGALKVTAGGVIGETGVITVTGTSAFTSTLGGAAIQLDTQSNALGGAVALTTAGVGDARIKNASGLTLDASNVGGALTVSAGGTIDEIGILSAGGNSRFTTTAGSIQLASQTNALSGTVDLSANGGSALLKNSGALTLGSATAGGDLTVTTLSGALTIGGAITAGGAGTVTLDGAGGLTLNSAVTTNAATQLVAGGAGYDGGAFTVSTGGHALTLITDNIVAAGGFDAGGAAMTIAATSGTALHAGSGNVLGALNLSDALLGQVTAGGLTLQTSGGADITVTGLSRHAGFGALTVTASSNATIGGGGGITQFANDLTVGATTIALAGDIDAGANQVTLNAAGTIGQNAGILTAGKLAGRSSGGAALDDANRIAALGDFRNSGAGLVTIGNSITLTQTAGTTLDAGAGTILIDNGGQDFIQSGRLTTTNGGASAVILRNIGHLTVGSILASSGTVTLGTAALPIGSVTESSGISAATLAANVAGALTLDGANQISGLGAITTGSDFVLLNNSALTQVGGTTVDVGSATILIDNGGQSFAQNGALQTASNSATAITIRNTGTLQIGTITAANGGVTLGTVANTVGPVSESGIITASSLSVTAAGAVTLGQDNAVRVLAGVTNGGGDIAFTNGTALTVGGPVTSAGNLSLTTKNGQLLTLSGTLAAAPAGTITVTGGGGILLAGATDANAATRLVANGTYDGAGFTFSTSGKALSLTADAITNISLFSTGAGTMTIAAAPGVGLAVGNAGAAGTLDVSDTVLARIASNGLALQTSGAADMVLSGVTAHPGFGALTLKSGRQILFDVGGSSFAGDVSATASGALGGVGIALAGDVNAAGHKVTLTASAGTIQQSGGVVTAATLSGSAVGGIALGDGNAVDRLAGLADTGSGDLLFRNNQALIVDGTASAVGAAGLVTIETANNGRLTLQGAIQSGGTVTLTGAGGIALGGTVTTSATTVLDTNGGTFTDNGFSLATQNHALNLTAGGLALSAATSLDSGTASMLLAAAGSAGISLGTAVPGTLSLTDADLARLSAGGLTLQTSGTGNIAVSGIGAHSGLGKITLAAAGDVAFGPLAANFAGDLSVSATNVTINGDIAAPGRTVTINAANSIAENAANKISAATLTGSSFGDANFAGGNMVALGAFNITGPGTLTFNSATALTLTAPITLATGNLSLGTFSGDITLATDITVAGSLSLNAAGALRQQSGILRAASFGGTAGSGASLGDANRFQSLTGFTNSGVGDVSISTAAALAVSGTYSTPIGSIFINSGGPLNIAGVSFGAGNNVVLRATGALHLAGGSFTAGRSVIFSASGPVTETAAASFNAPLVTFDSTGTPIGNLLAFQPGDIVGSLAALETGAGSSALSLDQITATRSTLLLVANAGIITANNIDVDQLAIAGVGGSASIGGTVRGTTGQGAAAIAFKSGEKDNHYRVNDCAVGTTSCIVVPRFVPVTPPTYVNFSLITPSRQSSDPTIQAFSVGNEDLLQ